MQRTSNRGLLLVVALLGSLTLYSLLPSNASRESRPSPVAPGAWNVKGGAADASGAAPELRPQPAEPLTTARGLREAADTLREAIRGHLLPLRISLELEQADHLALLPTSPTPGSGRTARLAGQIAGARGEPLAGEVHVIAGPNRGRKIHTDPAGRFGFTNLYPGLALLEVRGSGATLARREVRLTAATEAHFHVGLARPALVAGRLLDAGGEPIAGARVHVDGHGVQSDLAGGFEVGGVAGGRVLLEVEASGFTSLRRELDVRPGSSISADELELRLEPEARLRLSLTGEGDARSPTRIWILPAEHAATHATPWYWFDGLETQGGALEVHGLPPGDVLVHAYREGARLRGGAGRARLASGSTHALTLEFEPAPILTGRVLDNDVPLAGANVELHAADPLLAILGYLGLDGEYPNGEFLPLFAPAVSFATSDVSGAFSMNDATRYSGWRRLVVTSPDRQPRLERAVGPLEREVEVDVANPPGRPASLLVVPSRRSAALPYELFVHGELREAGTLEPSEDLRVDGLVAGRWHVRVVQGARELAPARTLDLEGEVHLPVELLDRPLSRREATETRAPSASGR
jgi:hypothetical protein